MENYAWSITIDGHKFRINVVGSWLRSNQYDLIHEIFYLKMKECDSRQGQVIPHAKDMPRRVFIRSDDSVQSEVWFLRT